MRTLLRQSLILALFSLALMPANAKQNYDQLTREKIADSYVTMQRFAEAENEYLSILSDKSIDLLTYDRVNIKLASAMYNIRKYKEAEKRFGAVIVRNMAAYTPQFACDYVNTLIRLEKLQRAADVAKQFNGYSASHRGYQPLQNLLQGLEQYGNLPSMTTAAVNKAPFNTKGSNFWCSRFNNGILFIHNDNNEAAMLRGAELYFYDGKSSKPYAKVPRTLQTGPACIYNNGKSMIYTDNHYREDQMVRLQKDEPIVTNYLNIVELSYNEKTQQWDNAKSIFNDKPFSSICHPSVSEDGERLYFAADFTDGRGGMDIYMSRKTKKGWSEPVNMGLSVNTKNDELYPNVSGNTLTFSSNGHKGLGGMDVYSVTLNDDGLPISKTLAHLPYPINTIYNDYAYMQDEDAESGYLTSDRPNGGDLDAIYSWVKRVQFAEKDPLLEGMQVVKKSAAFIEPTEQNELIANSVAEAIAQ
ncbi:MAG: hypothetical protein LBG19_09135 [Prevotellaceae bacterium]|nr:hypothetical protein [Prevotellaceae bacterium]